MASLAQHWGTSCQQVYSRPRRWRFQAPMVMRAHNPFWNRENWQWAAHGIQDANQVEGFKILGQRQLTFYRGEQVLYQVPNGYSAYVTVVVTFMLGITNVYFPKLIPIDLAVVKPDVANPTPDANWIFFGQTIDPDKGPITLCQLCLDEGQAIRARSTSGAATIVTVFGVESLEV